MAEQIKFTQLPNVGDLTASAIIALAQAQGGEYASYGASLAQVAELLNKGISYEELPTEAKDILGAITEIYNSGGGGGGSNVTMKDNPNGGVDLTVDGLLRTLALQGSGGGGTPEIYTAKLQGEGSSPWSTNSTTNKTLLDFGTIHLSKGVYVCMSNSTAWNFSTTNQGFAISVKWGDNVQTIHDNGEITTITLNGAFEVTEEGDYEVSFVGRVGGSEKTASLKPWSIMWGYIVGVGGSGGGSSVTMSDNTEGGVDLTVEDNTKTLATQKDLDTLYKITQGQSWDFVDQQESGTNLAPKGTQRQSLISVDGKSTQETTTGKNLSRFEYNMSWSATLPLITSPITSSKRIAFSDFIYNPTGKSFTVSLKNNEQKAWTVYARVVKDETLNTINLGNTNSDKFTFSINEDCDYMALFLGMDLFSSVDASAVSDLQVELGTTATPYEPYTGGLPSPNPAYPQPITSVEQLNFKVTGRNLFNPNASGVQDGYLDTDGSVKTSSISQTSDFIDVRKLNSVYLNYLGTNTVQKNIGYYDATKKFVTYGTYTSSRNIDVTNYGYIRFTFVKADKDLVQLSTTSVTEIEPYREETHTITPPFALNKIGDYADFANIEAGEWVKNYKYVDLGSLSWTKVSINPANGYYANLYDLPKSNDYSKMIMSRIYKADRHNVAMADKTISGYYDTSGSYVGQNWIYIRDTGVATVADLLNLVNGENAIYLTTTPTTEPIEATDLEYLKSLQNLDSDNVITITDQNGNDISYLMKYLVKLAEAI